jgi:preprotein translocase subunit SecD
MLEFTRTQAAAILITVLVICGLSIPNFVSDETIRGWPEWAQRRVTLAPELQGGTSLLLEVDRNDVRKQVLTSLRSDVRDVLRDAHIGLAYPMAMRSDSVEVRPLAGDFEVALAKLGQLSQAFNGVSPVEVTDEGGGLIRVTPTEAGVQEYELPRVRSSIEWIRARVFEIGGSATVEREGANRIRMHAPGLFGIQPPRY